MKFNYYLSFSVNYIVYADASFVNNKLSFIINIEDLTFFYEEYLLIKNRMGRLTPSILIIYIS